MAQCDLKPVLSGLEFFRIFPFPFKEALQPSPLCLGVGVGHGHFGHIYRVLLHLGANLSFDSHLTCLGSKPADGLGCGGAIEGWLEKGTQSIWSIIDVVGRIKQEMQDFRVFSHTLAL